MKIDRNNLLVLQLVRKAINPNSDVETDLFKDVDWDRIMKIAGMQGVICYVFDAFANLPLELRPERRLLARWFGQVNFMEQKYDKYIEILKKLNKKLATRHIPTVLMKGYGLSLNYPTPRHRMTGDIDFFHCGKGAEADEIVKSLGIKVKQNEEKHSTYSFDGVLVENHATIICELEHKALDKVEKFLEDELTNNSVWNSNIGCSLPSDMFNAVYLPLHLGFHFVYNEANFRQVLDWALFVNKHHSIDWNKVREFAEDAGYFDFLSYLNGIVIDYLGINGEYLPKWPRNKDIENKVLCEILSGSNGKRPSSYIGKMKRYIDNRWKYQLVFEKESHIKGFFLHLRSWLIWKWGIGGKNIWNQ